MAYLNVIVKHVKITNHLKSLLANENRIFEKIFLICPKLTQ